MERMQQLVMIDPDNIKATFPEKDDILTFDSDDEDLHNEFENSMVYI